MAEARLGGLSHTWCNDRSLLLYKYYIVSGIDEDFALNVVSQDRSHKNVSGDTKVVTQSRGVSP